MRFFIFFIFVILHTNSFSQIENTIFYNHNWKPASKKKAKYIREIIEVNDTTFHVSDSDIEGKLLMKGEYSSINPFIENGKFIFYDKDNVDKKSYGSYSNGTMSGEWSNYIGEKLIIQVNYSHNSIMHQSSKDTAENKIYSGEDLYGYLLKNLFYPPMAKHQNIEGKVFVAFTIDELGNVIEIRSSKKVNKDLETEGVRLISFMPDWYPKLKNGEPEKVKLVIPITFKIGSQE